VYVSLRMFNLYKIVISWFSIILVLRSRHWPFPVLLILMMQPIGKTQLKLLYSTAGNRHKQNSRFCNEIREDNFRFWWRRVHKDASQGMYIEYWKFNLHLCQEQLWNVRVTQFSSCFSWNDWFCEGYTSYTTINYTCF
jgi:hypothetical protein